MTLNERVILCRKRLHLNQMQMAEKLGVSQNYVWRLENRDSVPQKRYRADIEDRLRQLEQSLCKKEDY